MTGIEKRSRGSWPWQAQFVLSLLSVLGVVFVLIAPTIFAENAGSGTSSGTDDGNQTQLFVALTAVLLTGIFMFMTFRIDRGARNEAREVAKAEAEKGLTKELKKIVEETLEEKALCSIINQNSGRIFCRVKKEVQEQVESLIDKKFSERQNGGPAGENQRTGSTRLLARAWRVVSRKKGR